MIFKDRVDAGRQLAQKLTAYKNKKNTIVVALPRGGVVLGYEVAKELNLPLDIVVPRKIGHPHNPEYAIGAITESGEGIFNETEKELVDPQWLKSEIAKEKKEALRRLKTYRGDNLGFEIKNKIVILVDDGIATGLTMRAAIKSIKKKNPQKIIVAVPVTARDCLAKIKKQADEVIYLDAPLFFGAVGAFYEVFGQTQDEEVVELMKRSSKKFD